MTRLEKAFIRMKDLIAEGVEFPDAEWKVTTEFDLTDEEVTDLVNMYDTEQEDRDSEHDLFLSDAEADADALASAGHGDDEAYGGIRDEEGCDNCHDGE